MKKGCRPRTRLRTIRTLTDLRPDPLNANRGTSRGRRLLRESLRTSGTGRSVLVDRTGQIIAGHKTLEEAQALGVPITVVANDGRSLVAIQRTDLDPSDPRTRALAIADNRVAELDLAWDPAVLERLRTDGLNIEGFWTPEEWTTLVGAETALDPAADQVLAPGPTTIRRGDLFRLGSHRLLCGDACDAADVARLLDGEVPVLMCVGDPRYLDEARKILGDLRTVWGLDAPQQVEVLARGNPYAGLSEAALREELARQDRLLAAIETRKVDTREGRDG